MADLIKDLLPFIRHWLCSLKENILNFLARKKQNLELDGKDLQLVAQSEYFDARWYLQQYPDIARANIPPALHYLLYGGFEGRNPSNAFSSNLYLQNHPQLIETHINPLVHYLRHKPAQSSKTPLYLHVGLHKTGTSAIQKLLRSHAGCLQGQGFYYPPDIYEGDAHHGLPSILRQSANLENLCAAESWLKNCHRYCQAHDLSLLLSSEVFSEPIRYDVLARLLQPFDVTVILYIRRQDLLIESVLNQILKGRPDIRPDDVWMDFDPVYVVDFTKRIEQWRFILPKSKIVLSRYEISSRKRPLEVDFLDALGIKSSCLSDKQTETVNISLSLYEFTILRRLAQKGLLASRAALEQARINLSEKIAKYQIVDGPMVGNYFSLEVRQRIMDMYSVSNERIRAEFFPQDQNLFVPLEPKVGLKIDPNIVQMLESEMIQNFPKERPNDTHIS